MRRWALGTEKGGTEHWEGERWTLWALGSIWTRLWTDPTSH